MEYIKNLEHDSYKMFDVFRNIDCQDGNCRTCIYDGFCKMFLNVDHMLDLLNIFYSLGEL